ncbi:MAG TPA: SGNH/GDSL hydrolase family protein [Thermoanaerobaculia bacterium]|jgi:lysophospholipase L1-like esterase
MKTYWRIAAAIAFAAVAATPMFAVQGKADFSRFVALGDSYGAGVESSSLNERHQPFSWPAVIARQVGLTICPRTATATDNCFAEPLVSFPGIGPELQLVNLAPTIVPAPGQGVPLMTGFGRPYNNLSIPGGTIGSTLALTGAEPAQANEPTPVTFSRFILRGLGTAPDQALALHPTFIAIWLGGNDYLSIAFSGTPATMTSAADFRARYEALVNKLATGAPNAGMVLGNLPVAAVPYISLVPPLLVDPNTRQPILGPNGQPIFFIARTGDTVAQLTPNDFVLLHARADLAQGYGLPAAFKNIPPFNALPHVGEPLPDADVVTAAEFAQVTARVAEYNKAITDIAGARGIPVADIAGLFNRVSHGFQVGPVRISKDFITGGFYSLDGFHLTDAGYMLFANEYIKAINAGYGTRIPVAGLGQLMANNGGFFPQTITGQTVTDGSGWTMSDDTVRQIRSIMYQQPTRARAVRH